MKVSVVQTSFDLVRLLLLLLEDQVSYKAFMRFYNKFILCFIQAGALTPKAKVAIPRQGALTRDRIGSLIGKAGPKLTYETLSIPSYTTQCELNK